MAKAKPAKAAKAKPVKTAAKQIAPKAKVPKVKAPKVKAPKVKLIKLSPAQVGALRRKAAKQVKVFPQRGGAAGPRRVSTPAPEPKRVLLRHAVEVAADGAAASEGPLTRVTPLLSVADMERALAFYRDRLGFTVEEQLPPGANAPLWAHLRLGGMRLMLAVNPHAAAIEGVRGVTLYAYCHDVTGWWNRLKQKGEPVQPLKVTVYGMKEFTLVDPDGWQLCFGQPTREPPTD